MTRWAAFATRGVLVAAVLAVAAPAFSQTVSDHRLWTNFNAQGRAADGSPWRWAFDAQFRTRDGVETVDLTSGRGTITREVRSHLSVGGGVAVNVTYPAAGTQVEQRLFQQLVWSGRAAGGTIALRTRLEQRFLEADDRIAWRIRQHVRLARPLTASGRLVFVVADEVFSHVASTRRVARGFDQHRVSLGLRRLVTARTAVEVSYVNQYLRLRSAPSRMTHALNATFSWTVRE